MFGGEWRIRTSVGISRQIYSLIPLSTRATPHKNGAGGRIRTDDLLITNQLLSQLSYASNKGNDRWRVASRQERRFRGRARASAQPAGRNPEAPRFPQDCVEPRLNAVTRRLQALDLRFHLGTGP